MATIEVEDIGVTINGKTLLDGVSLKVASGDVLAIIGPSGSGKTTLLRTVLGFVAPTRGVVRLRGTVASADGKVLRAPEERNLGVVFQDLALWPHLTVAGNLEFGLRAHGVPRAERDSRISSMLERVSLSAKKRAYPGELSGGERQRVAIARALVLEPDAVLLDEPLSNLDIVLRREMLALFRELFQEHGTTAIYVSHDPQEAFDLATNIVVVEFGRLSQIGTPDQLRTAPASAFVRDATKSTQSHGGG